jgi:hypothetical protein
MKHIIFCSFNLAFQSGIANKCFQKVGLSITLSFIVLSSTTGGAPQVPAMPQR